MEAKLIVALTEINIVRELHPGDMDISTVLSLLRFHDAWYHHLGHDTVDTQLVPPLYTAWNAPELLTSQFFFATCPVDERRFSLLGGRWTLRGGL